jgi:hypothetical protein
MDLSNKTLKSSLIYLFFLAWLINIALHIPSFERTTFRGDENVYIALSQIMGWDLSNYSTASHPILSKWPHTTYQNPVFHHGPLLPYVLKIGAVFGYSTTAALLFANFAMAMLLLHMVVLYRRLAIPPVWRITGFFAAAFAPLLLFSTTRIHHDALAGIFIACAVIAFIEALEKRSLAWSLWSGFLFAAALNMSYGSIISLPLIVFCQMYYLYSVQPEQPGSTFDKRTFIKTVLNFEHWKVFVIVSLIVTTLGLQHYYRIFHAYGSIFPSDFMHPILKDAWVNNLITTRTRSKMFANLISLIPLFIVFFLPQTWRTISKGLVRKDWGAICTIFTLYLLLAIFVFSFREMRLFATATPMFYCCLPWIIAQSKPKLLPFYLCLIALSFFLMSAASYREVIVRPNEVWRIVPVIYELIPPLLKYW